MHLPNKFAFKVFLMDIPDIKSHLSIAEVLLHYGLQPNKNKMLCYPFHPDETPSMQVYPKTNTMHCFLPWPMSSPGHINYSSAKYCVNRLDSFGFLLFN